MRLLAGFVLALAESGLGLGAIVPGEVAISAIAAATRGPGATVTLGVVVALGAVTGDHLGFLLGRHGGSRLRETSLVARLGVERWDRAVGLVRRHGIWAMLASRVLPVVRAAMPAVAGAAAMGDPPFLLASVLGAVAWSSLWVGVGSGLSSTGLADHPGLLAVAGAAVLVGAVVRRVVRRRREHGAVVGQGGKRAGGRGTSSCDLDAGRGPGRCDRRHPTPSFVCFGYIDTQDG